MAKKRNRSAEPVVTFWGAASSVTGSMHHIDGGGQSILLDCGLFQGRRAESFQRNRQFPFRPKDIDAVVLSHAHIDHCGNLPNLVKQGFRGPIYCTPATGDLAAVMMGDAAKIQQEDAGYLNRHRDKGEPKVEPLFDGRDVYHTILRLKAIAYYDPFAIGHAITGTFVDAGHLLGSAMVRLRIDSQVGERSITFTGDLGRPGLPILRDPEAVPPSDLLISESTYGGHLHEAVDETVERLGEVVAATVKRGGKVIIPAFAVGRTQTIIYFLHQLIVAGQLIDVPIFVDSPLALRATEVFKGHPECFDDETRQFLQKHPYLFGDQHIRYIEKVHDSIALNARRDPCVVISASGMCEGGRVLHHLKHNIGDPRNTILIAGYQAADTLGRRLVDRRAEVRILGKLLPVKAEIVVLNGLSSHADHGDLLRSLSPLADTVRLVRLVHGELDRATALAEALKSVGFADVAIPVRGDSITLA